MFIKSKNETVADIKEILKESKKYSKLDSKAINWNILVKMVLAHA